MPITATEYAAWSNAAYAEEELENTTKARTREEIEGLSSPLEEFENYGGTGKEKGVFEILVTKVDYLVVRKVGTKEVVVAIKGTSNGRDLVSDTFIVGGVLGSDKRMVILRNVVRSYKRDGYDLSVTGHSLGGALAAELAKTENVLGVVFNMGSGLGEVMSPSIEMDDLRGAFVGNVIHFHLSSDIVSTASTWLDRYQTFNVDGVKDPLNAHFMHNFGGLDDEEYQSEIDTRAELVRVHQKEMGPVKGDVDMKERL